MGAGNVERLCAQYHQRLSFLSTRNDWCSWGDLWRNLIIGKGQRNASLDTLGDRSNSPIKSDKNWSSKSTIGYYSIYIHISNKEYLNKLIKACDSLLWSLPSSRKIGSCRIQITSTQRYSCAPNFLCLSSRIILPKSKHYYYSYQQAATFHR